MIQLEYDVYSALGIVIGSLLLYVILHFPAKRKELKLGLLIFAYIRDITKLLTFKLLGDWRNLSIPQKLDRLKSIYDVIISFDEIRVVHDDKKSENISDILNNLPVDEHSIPNSNPK